MPAPWVEPLLALQAVDMRIRDLNQRLTLLPKEIEKLAAKQQEAFARFENARNTFQKMESTVKAAEKKVAELNDAIKKLQQQSVMVKKNNEYQAMLQEVASHQMKIGQLETMVIDGLDKIEAAKPKVAKIKSEAEAVVKSAQSEIKELEEFRTEVKNEIANLTAGRPQLVRKIETAVLQRYEVLLRDKNLGLPLAKVEDGICENCHMRITNQLLSDIASGAVTSCNNCMHLIYLAE